MGIGAMLPWITTSLQGLADELSPTYFGVDLPDGLVVLGLAAVILAATLLIRARGRAGHRSAVVALVGAIIVIGVCGTALATATARFEPTVVDDIMASIAPAATPQDAAEDRRAQITELVVVRTGPGPWIALAGGALAFAGSTMTFAWVARRHRAARLALDNSGVYS